MEYEGLAVWGDLSGTLRPEGLYLDQLAGEFTPEESVGRISARPELVGWTAGGEQGDSSGVVVHRPSFPD